MRPISGTPNRATIPNAPIPNSSSAYTRIGATVALRGNQPWQSGAAQAQAAHVGRQQQTQGYGGRADYQLKQLEPDDFVNERRAAAAGKQQQPGEEMKGNEMAGAIRSLRSRSARLRAVGAALLRQAPVAILRRVGPFT